MNSSIRIALAFTLLAATAAPAFAAWPNAAALNLPVCRATGFQQATQLVPDGAGGAILTWQDGRASAYHIYAQHVLVSGVVDPAWPVDGLSLNNSAGAQTSPVIVSDGAGGAIVAWSDSRSGTHPYAQHVLAGGTLDPAWPAGGLSLSSATGNQIGPVISSDGGCGAIVAWFDLRTVTNYDIYAQHALASGIKDPAWPGDGAAVCTAAGNQTTPAIVSDAAGGAIIAWNDGRTSTTAIYAQRVLASGVVSPAWTANGIPVATPAGAAQNVRLVTDGLGGAIAAWEDYRSGATRDVYAQHIVSSAGLGAVDPYWPANGRALCTAANEQYAVDAVPDGGGGALVAWQDMRSGSSVNIYAGHVLAGGATDPAWPANGLAVCTDVTGQSSPSICSDGSGGAIVAWIDQRAGLGASDVYVQHALPTGSVDSAWPVNGRAACNASGAQLLAKAISDGAGGTIVTWQDFRNSSDYDIYAQRVAKGGYLGTPEAEMAGVKDVPNDNGGHVKVSWNASYLESDPYDAYTYYELFRSVPTHLAAQRAARGERVHASSDAVFSPGDLVAVPAGAATAYWEFLDSFSGLMVPGYSYVAPTTGDSMGVGNPKTLFMVQTRAGSQVWNSPPDSGYSVDNLPPVTPAPFTGAYGAGTAHLHWNPNPDADLANYRLYRGSSAGFVPSNANLVATPPDTGWADAAGAPYAYKLSAIDVHGNESPAATLVPNGTTDVGGPPPPLVLALAPASPNPAARGATFRYALPRAGVASLALYDAAGRRVRTLLAGQREAGAASVPWDLRDDAGRAVGAGLYFARLETPSGALVRRVVVAR